MHARAVQILTVAIAVLRCVDISAQQVATSSSSQVRNITVQQGAGGVITITYDLAAGPPTAAYSVSIEVSSDQGVVKASSVAGDVGTNVAPGPRKTIVWESGKDVEQVQLDRFRIRINVTPVAAATAAPKSNKGLIIGVAAGGAAVAGALAAAGGGTEPNNNNNIITPPIVTSQPSCSFSVSPSSVTFTSGGGVLDLQVSVGPSNCANSSWSVTSTPSFVQVRAGSSGVGNGTVSISADQNLTPSTRSGNLVVAGQTVPVTQVSNCTYDAEFLVQVGGRRRAVVDAAGTTDPFALRRTINVFASGNCTWELVSSQVPWLAFDRTSGAGNGQVVSLLQTNTGAARETTFTLAGLTMTVRQCAAGTTRNSAGECP